jgi:hypothetical protein
MNPRPPQTADVRTAMPSAIATVVAYWALTFWPLVPAGWVVWWRLDKGRPAVGPARASVWPEATRNERWNDP